MIVLHVTDTEILIATSEKKSFGKPTIHIIGKVDYEKHNLAVKLSELIEEKSEIALTISDFKTYLYRFEVPLYITQEALISTILDKAREIIPTPLEELLYDFAILGKTAEAHIILFAATPKDTLTNYFSICEKNGSRIIGIVPDTIAVFEILKPTIREDDLLLYLEEQDTEAKIAFYDEHGPFLTIAEPIPTHSLHKELENALKVVKERYGKEVTKLILGGKKGISEDPFRFKKNIDVPTITITKIIEHTISEYAMDISLSKQEHPKFLEVIGLALLISGNALINLVREDTNERMLYIPSQLTSSEKTQDIHTAPVEELTDNVHGSENKVGFPIKKIAFSFIALVAIAGLGLVLWKVRPGIPKKTQLVQHTSPKQTISRTPTPSPIPTIARSGIKIEVLNGSGTTGQAGKVATNLKNDGFTNITTGNADNFGYKGVTIQTDTNGQTYLDEIKKVLSGYTNITIGGALNGNTNVDVRIILGK